MSAKDLSLEHGLMSDLFRWPPSAKELEQYKLSEEQVNFFNDNGYLAGIKMVDEQQVEELRKQLAVMVSGDFPGKELFYEYNSNESTDPDTVLFHALGAWRVAKAFHDILWNPRFLVAAKQLLGNKAVRFWHDQLFYKPAKKGGVVAWHQDYSYWTRTKPLAHLTCWCALDDVNEENGCLQYIPGSHQWGLLPKPVIAGNFDGIKDFLNEEQLEQFFHPVKVPVKAGEAIFHHPLTLHGSGENKSNQPRRAFVINVVADGVYSDTDDPLLEGIPALGKGKKLDGQFFPLLYQ
jgi:ectoine hydroxylase-related dioxygenase (phytanoyl-CoA dioxygenase family)